jgi:hypothetical protein
LAHGVAVFMLDTTSSLLQANRLRESLFLARIMRVHSIHVILAAVALLASVTLNAYCQGVKEPAAGSNTPKPKAPSATDAAAEVDWQAIVGKTAYIETARDTEPDMPAAKVLEVVQDARTKKVRGLKIESSARAKSVVLPIANIKRVSLAAEVIYESAKGRIESEQRAEWTARAKANGVVAWDYLTPEQHASAVEKHREFMAGVVKEFPGLSLHESSQYLFYTDLPASAAASLLKNLDEMHNAMCALYGIKKGTPVWQGKCLVVVFTARPQWDAFRQKFSARAAPASANATCTQSDGMVLVNGCSGKTPDVEFTATLVHETSHGFAYRWRTGQRLPGWVSEGLADLVAVTLVPLTREKTARETAAIGDLRKSRVLGSDFFSPKDRITGLQYGVALSLNRFMHKRNPKAYVAFLGHLKEGATWEESLKQSYQMTPAQLVSAYGQTIGVADLKYAN